MFELIVFVYESIIASILAIVEAVVSVFVAGSEAIGAADALLIALLYVVETGFWLILCVFELFAALFQWRKPKKPAKPVIWRPKILNKAVDAEIKK